MWQITLCPNTPLTVDVDKIKRYCKYVFLRYIANKLLLRAFCRAFNLMIEKGKWKYEPTRGIARSSKNPAEADTAMKEYLASSANQAADVLRAEIPKRKRRGAASSYDTSILAKENDADAGESSSRRSITRRRDTSTTVDAAKNM
jgi:hypothetical protein